MANTQLLRIRSITEYHKVMELPKPEHPLISVINLETIIHRPGAYTALVFDFYSISLKRDFSVTMKYGQQEYDFNDGIMFFISPGQVFGIEYKDGKELKRSGWLLLVHPDFLWNTPLANMAKHYEFFDYTVHEALFVSEKEELIITGMMQIMQDEYRARIDKFSQEVMIAQMELLLTYAKRFYDRQFITRKKSSHQVLTRLEELLNTCFDGDAILKRGLPTVAHVAESLNVSPGYLSGLLKSLTGMNTQQHIHQKLIDKAKEKLSTTGSTVSEIAYGLGFEHPQSFSKLFKTKTHLSPLEFRQSFN